MLDHDSSSSSGHVTEVEADLDHQRAPRESSDSPSLHTSSIPIDEALLNGQGLPADATDAKKSNRRVSRKRSRSETNTDGQAHEEQPPPRRPRGRPKGSQTDPSKLQQRDHRTGNRGPRATAEPSKEFKELQAKATVAFLERSLETALEHAKRAIQINPEIFAAHSLLSQIYYDMGLKEESLGVLWSGAHVQRQPGVWWEVAGRLIEMENESANRQDIHEKLLYCYSAVIRLDAKNFDARKARLDIYMELDQLGQCVRECNAMAKLRPHDLEVLQLLADLCISASQPQRALDAYNEAVDYYQKQEVEHQSSDFTFSDLNIFLEIYAHARLWDEGLEKMRSVSRWLCGRSDETFWDSYTDDREWDMDHQSRRVQVEQFDPNNSPLELYGLGLPPEIKTKFGIFRLRAGAEHFQEAMNHFKTFDSTLPLQSRMAFDYPDICLEIADTLFDTSHYTEALTFYTGLAAAHRMGSHVQERTGYCYFALSDLEKAIDIYQSLFERNPSRSDLCITIAKIYGAKRDDKAASKYVQLARELGRSNAAKEANFKPVQRSHDMRGRIAVDQPEESTNTGSEVSTLETLQKPVAIQPRRRINRLVTKRRFKTLGDSLRPAFEQLKTLLPRVRTGNDAMAHQWLVEAAQLVEVFHLCKLFVVPAGRSRHGSKPDHTTSSVVQEQEATHEPDNDSAILIPEYRGLSLAEWLDLLCEYALLKAKRQDSVAAYNVLDTAIATEALMTHTEALKTLHICLFTCALITADEERACNVARWFMKTFNSKTDSFRLYAALNRLHPGEPSWYNAGPSQKFVMRQIKLLDFTVLDEQSRNKFTFSEQERLSWSTMLNASASSEPKTAPDPRELNPALLTLYGNMLATPGSYINALNYYFRAFVVDPGNALLLLSIANAFAQYALKRQCENRHYHIFQGLAFFDLYENARLANIDSDNVSAHERSNRRQELHFNRAKLWHMIGLVHLAVPAYEKCIVLAREASEAAPSSSPSPLQHDCEVGGGINNNEPNFAREAAFALQSIYATNGDLKAARRISQSLLVF